MKHKKTIKRVNKTIPHRENIWRHWTNAGKTQLTSKQFSIRKSQQNNSHTERQNLYNGQECGVYILTCTTSIDVLNKSWLTDNKNSASSKQVIENEHTFNANIKLLFFMYLTIHRAIMVPDNASTDRQFFTIHLSSIAYYEHTRLTHTHR